MKNIESGKHFELVVPKWLSENDLMKVLNDSPDQTHEGLQKAVDSYRQAIRLDEEFSIAHLALANIYIENKTFTFSSTN